MYKTAKNVLLYFERLKHEHIAIHSYSMFSKLEDANRCKNSKNSYSLATKMHT